MEGQSADGAACCGKPVTVGLAGGMGSGKSVVSRILRVKGYAVYDCDREARRLMQELGNIRQSLCRWCGESVYCADGTLDRPALAGLLFGDTELRGRVNSLVHEEVRRDFARFRDRSGAATVFVESALMATSGLAEDCDMILNVSAPEGLRAERAVKRGLDRTQALARIEAQRAEEEALGRYAAKTLTLLNDGSAPLTPQIDQVLESLEALEKPNHTN